MFSRIRGWFSDKKVPPAPATLADSVIEHDKFDLADYEEAVSKIGALKGEAERLGELTPVGGDLMRDLFLTLVRGRPKLVDREEVRPSHHLAHQVIAEAMDLPEFRRLHAETAGDPWFAGMAAAGMGRLLEPIIRRLKDQQEQADQLDETMQQLADAETERALLEQQMADLAPKDAEASQADLDAMAAQVADLLAQAQDEATQLDTGMTISTMDVSAAAQEAVVRAADKAADTKAMCALWGTDPGQLTRMSVEEHMRLAAMLDSAELRELTKLIGAMRLDVLAARSTMNHYTPSEVFAVERGNNLARVLPSEKAKLMDPVRQMEFLRGYMNRTLMQYKLRANQKVGQGAIVCAIDTSGSMTGQRLLWAKATSYHLLQIAREEERAFVGIVFASSGMFKTHHFATADDYTTERMWEWATATIGGGTDFMTPMNEAIRIFDAEYAETGKVTGDAILISDGEDRVDDDWFEWYCSERKRLEFDCYGVLIGGYRGKYEPGMEALTDGKVSGVHDLFSAKETSSIFAAL